MKFCENQEIIKIDKRVTYVQCFEEMFECRIKSNCAILVIAVLLLKLG